MGIKDTIRQFEQSSQTVLIVKDHRVGVELSIRRENVTNIYYAEPGMDVAYLSFIGERKVVTPYDTWFEESEIKDWPITCLCELEIKEEVDDKR